MMNKEQIENRIFELIETKDFDQLTPGEIELVLSAITKTQFEERRNTIINSQEVFSSEKHFITPDPITLSLLQNQIIKESNNNVWFAWVIGLLEFKIPVYGVAPAIGLVILFFYLTNGKTRVPQIEYMQKEVVVYVPKVDTVYNDRIVEVPIIERVEVVKYVERTNGSISIEFNDQDRMATGTYSQDEMPQIDALDISFGNSKIKTDELAQFRKQL
ncbi:MAG: hypothetical protein ACPGEG_07745 [Salibacteraceae bacterium]